MQILESQLSKESLSRFGKEAISLLIGRDFTELANRFGYALAFDQDPAKAIERAFNHSISGSPEGQVTLDLQQPTICVKYFESNTLQLLALVECVPEVAPGTRVLAELVAARNGEVINLYLEQISGVA